MKCCLEYNSNILLSDRTSVLLREGIDFLMIFFKNFPDSVSYLTYSNNNIKVGFKMSRILIIG